MKKRPIIHNESAYDITYEATTALGVDLIHDIVIATNATRAFELATKRLILFKAANMLRDFKITRVHRIDLDRERLIFNREEDQDETRNS